MPYRVRVSAVAEDDIRRLPGNVRQRIRRLVGALAGEPRPSRARELRGMAGLFRLRVDDWRVIYAVDDRDRVVVVLAVRRKSGPETYEEIAP